MNGSVIPQRAEAELDAVLHRLTNRPYARDLFGIALVDARAGEVTLALDQRPELGHLPGWFHGTVTSALAECAASMSGITLAAGAETLALQQSIHFTGPARGERLVAIGRVVKPGRRITTTAADVFVERDGERYPCAVMTMTMMHVEGGA